VTFPVLGLSVNAACRLPPLQEDQRQPSCDTRLTADIHTSRPVKSSPPQRQPRDQRCRLAGARATSRIYRSGSGDVTLAAVSAAPSERYAKVRREKADECSGTGSR
jgi:hypothetical protein